MTTQDELEIGTILDDRSLRTMGIRPLGQGVALLDATWEIHAPSSDGSSTTVIASFVVVRSNEVWRIAASRLMVPMQFGR